jgi:beta-lactamase class A
VRGWATLLVLLLAAAVVSLGPDTLRELISGLTFARPPAASIAPAPLHTEPALQARLEAVGSAATQGSLGVAVVDLQRGAMGSVDAARAYPAASLFKLPLLLEVLTEAEAGRLDPERRLEIRPEDWTDGSGVLQARVGDQLAVRELTRLMIQDSDNIAALVLLDAVGIGSVNALTERLGMPATRLVDHRAGEPGDHTTSASDMAHLLVGLATGQLVSQRVAEQALSLLELKQSVTWLGDDLPFWVKIAHKWGDLPEARHDAGIVYTPRGSYAIAVLTENGPADESAKAIARVSRVAYDYLGNQ